ASKRARNPKDVAPDSQPERAVPFTGTPADIDSLLNAMLTLWRKSEVRNSLRKLTRWDDKQIETVLTVPDTAIVIQRAARMIVLEITITVLTLLVDRASNEEGALKLALELCGLQSPENAAGGNAQS